MKIYRILSCLIITLLFLCPIQVSAMTYGQGVYDKANIFSSAQIEELNELCKESEQAGIPVFILSSDSRDKDYYKYSGDSFSDYWGTKLGTPDFACLFIDMNSDSFNVFYEGESAKKIPADTVEDMKEQIRPLLNEGDFFNASKILLEKTIYFANNEESSQTTKIMQDILIPALTYAIVPAIVIVGVLVAVNISKAKTKTIAKTANNYVDNSNFIISHKSDYFVRKYTTKREKPKNNTQGKN